MGIGSGDDLDKKLVEKYSDEQTICPCNYSPKQAQVPDYTTHINQEAFEKFDIYDDVDKYLSVAENFRSLNKKYNELKQRRNKEKELQDIRQEMHGYVNPNKMYERLGVDILSIFVSSNLLPIVDPEQNDNNLFVDIAYYRRELTDTLGYVIPNIRIIEGYQLKDYEYIICVKGHVVFTGQLSNEDLINNNKKEIIRNLHKICIKHAHQIMRKTDALKLMELVRSQDPTLVNDLIPTYLTPIDLKYICASLIQEGIGIKDIVSVFEILNNYARYTQDLEELTEILKKEMQFYK